MNIPIATLLDKINRQVHEAKLEVHSGNERKVRERLTAIKTLCELVLEEEKSVNVKPIQPQIEHFNQNKMVASSKPLNEEDANGDDIFDF